MLVKTSLCRPICRQQYSVNYIRDQDCPEDAAVDGEFHTCINQTHLSCTVAKSISVNGQTGESSDLFI